MENEHLPNVLFLDLYMFASLATVLLTFVIMQVRSQLSCISDCLIRDCLICSTVLNVILTVLYVPY